MEGLRAAARRVWRIGLEVYQKYGEDGGPLIAAAISFFALLSIIPLVLLGVWGLGQFLRSEEAFQYVIGFLQDYLPGSSKLQKGVKEFLQQLVDTREAIGWLGVAGLLWSGSQGFVVLEMAINHALRAPERRNFLESRLLGFGMILIAGGSLALSLVITSTVTAIQQYDLPIVDWRAGDIPVLWTLVGALVPVLLTVISFTVMYGVLPSTLVPWRTALIAGTLAGLLWEAAKRLFTYYLARVSYDQIYGPVGSVIGLVFWIYYSAVIIILGAELVSVLLHIHPRRPPTGSPQLPSPEESVDAPIGCPGA